MSARVLESGFGGPRLDRLCRCRRCGAVERCVPGTDYYTVAGDALAWLYCEACFKVAVRQDTLVEVEPFVRSTPPVRIDDLPYVHFRAHGVAPAVDATWAYFPTKEERDKNGLRVELHRSADGSGEARLVRGEPDRPKHLRVLRVRYFAEATLKPLVRLLMLDYRQKGW